MRLYRRFDSDLIALHESGVPVNILAELLLEAYADGRSIRLLPEGCTQYDPSKRSKLHLSIRVSSDKAKAVLKGIRYGYRNQFSKALVRDALVLNPIWMYFSSSDLIEAEDERIHAARDSDVIVLPPGLTKSKYRKLFNGEEIKPKRKTKVPAVSEKKPRAAPAEAPAPDPKPAETNKEANDDDFFKSFDQLF